LIGTGFTKGKVGRGCKCAAGGSPGEGPPGLQTRPLPSCSRAWICSPEGYTPLSPRSWVTSSPSLSSPLKKKWTSIPLQAAPRMRGDQNATTMRFMSSIRRSHHGPRAGWRRHRCFWPPAHFSAGGKARGEFPDKVHELFAEFFNAAVDFWTCGQPRRPPRDQRGEDCCSLRDMRNSPP